MNSGKAAAPARTIALCFLIIIFVGAVLLTLPVSHNPGAVVRPLDALFTATSAACVTGLCTGAGLGLATLWRANRRPKENLLLMAALYLAALLIGSLSGLLLG